MHLNAHLDVDVVALESDDSVTVMLELQAPAAPETGTPRPEHTAVVVLDRSGSMSGPRLAHAKRALVDLVDRLDDRDRFGLVTFDSETEVVVPAGKVGDRGRDRIRRDIASVRSRGMTDLSVGLLPRPAGGPPRLHRGRRDRGAALRRARQCRRHRPRGPGRCRPERGAPVRDHLDGRHRHRLRRDDPVPRWPAAARATTPSPSTPTRRRPLSPASSTACCPRPSRRPAC